MQLAELIINSLATDNFLTEAMVQNLGDNELLDILQKKDTEKLAYWLNFHSFTKYRLEKALQKFEDFDVSKPQAEQVTAVNSVMKNHFEEILKKKELKKFLAEDFSKLAYIERKNLLSDLMDVALKGGRPINSHYLEYLLNAKMRRNETLGRHLQVEYVSAKEYAAESTTRKLAKKMLAMKPGERKQFFYFYLGEEHSYGFDVEVTKEGKINIFCFESAADPRHLAGVDQLYKYLSKSGREFDIKSTRAEYQMDSYNCGTYTLGVINELAKYDHVYDYLPTEYTPNKDIENIKESSSQNALGRVTKYTFNNLDKITWVNLHDMPIKIISMGQSYTQMENNLKVSQNFDLDAEKFVKQARIRDQYDEKQEKTTKYINRKREHIREYLKKAADTIIKPAYEEYVKEHPIFKRIDEGEKIDFHKEIIENDKYPTIEEKSKLMETYLKIILLRNNIGTGSYPYKEAIAVMPPQDLKAFLELRNEYLIFLSKLSLKEFKNAYNDYNGPLRTDIDQYIDLSKLNFSVTPVTEVLWTKLPDRMTEILTTDSEWQYPRFFKIPNPLVFDPKNIANITEDNIKSTLKKAQATYINSKGQSAIATKDILDFLENYYYQINKAIPEESNEKLRLIGMIQNVFIHYLRELPDINTVVSKISHGNLFDNSLDIISAMKLDPPLKSSIETLSELFSIGELAYLPENLGKNFAKYFPVIDKTNPILKMVEDKKNLKFFTSENIINAINDFEAKFAYSQNGSLFPKSKSLEYLQDTFSKILEIDQKENKYTVGELEKIFHEMSHAYFVIADEMNDAGQTAWLSDRGLLSSNLHLLLSEKKPPLTVKSIMQELEYIKDPFLKIQIVKTSFKTIKENAYDTYTNKSILSLSPFSYRQMADMGALQKVFILALEEAIQKNKDGKLNSTITLAVANAKSLIDFDPSPFAGFFESETRKKVKNLLLSNPTTKKEMEKETQQMEQQQKPQTEGGVGVLVTKISSLYATKKVKSAGEAALEYYHSKPQLIDISSNIVSDKAHNLDMYMFSSSSNNPFSTLWVSYGSSKRNRSDNEYDWKFNISVDEKDMEKALPIIIEAVAKYEIGALKVMSPGQVKFTRNDKDMLGREFVLYCHYNPEITAEKWLDIIKEIESNLEQNGINPSVEECPKSNRQLGKYTSYTHEAWTAHRLNVPFKEGIKESGLDDEDPFEKFTYQEEAKKTSHR